MCCLYILHKMKGRDVLQMNSRSGNACCDVLKAHVKVVSDVIETECIQSRRGTSAKVNGVTFKDGSLAADTINIAGYDLRFDAMDVTYLKQSDFDSGTYRIKKSGKYVLTEDIEFDPIPEKERDDKPNVGWFAVMSVESTEVVIDFNGYTAQAAQAYLDKHIIKVFAVVELGNAPFPGVPFPLNTVAFQGDAEFFASSRVVIQNGCTGLSSHHGIHGNGCREVVIANMTLSDHEVAGITLNSPMNVDIIGCTISGSRHTITNRSRTAQLQTLVNSIKLYPNAADYLKYLQYAEDALAAELANRSQNPITDPDGNTYGITIGPAPASGGPRLNEAECANVPDLGYQKTASNVRIINCDINNIHGMPNQQVACVADISVSAYGGSPGAPKPQQLVGNHAGNFGSLMWHDFFPNGNWNPNEVVKAQTWLLKQRRLELGIADNASYFLPAGFEDNMLGTSPNQAVFLSTTRPGFSFDIAHVNKGVFGIKMGCVEGGLISGCRIGQVHNLASPSKLLSDVAQGDQFNPNDPGIGLGDRYIGNDAFGISLENCKNVHVECTKASELKADSGFAFGLSIYGESNTCTFDDCDFQSVHVEYDPATPDIPNPLAEAYGVQVQSSDGSRLNCVNVRNLQAPRCAYGYFVSNSRGTEMYGNQCHRGNVYAEHDAARPKHLVGFQTDVDASSTTLAACSSNVNYVSGEDGEVTKTTTELHGFLLTGDNELMDSCSALQNDAGAGTSWGVKLEGTNSYTTGVKTIRNTASVTPGEGYGFVDAGIGDINDVSNVSAANKTAD